MLDSRSIPVLSTPVVCSLFSPILSESHRAVAFGHLLDAPRTSALPSSVRTIHSEMVPLLLPLAETGVTLE